MTELATPKSPSALRMKPVVDRAHDLRILFEMEKQFALVVMALIPAEGCIEKKYRLCEHAWEAAQHARFLRDRGRELPGFSKDDDVRDDLRTLFDEALLQPTPAARLDALYGVLKPAMTAAYQHYLRVTENLGDWPTTKLIEGFLADEDRHAREATGWSEDGVESVRALLAARGGILLQEPAKALPAGFQTARATSKHTWPAIPNRGKYPVAEGAFGEDYDACCINPVLLADPAPDARVVRIMIYIWLFLELDAVDYLATVPYDTPDMPFDFHYDVIRHLWDESRHSQFGFRQLPKLGISLDSIEQQVGLYEVLIQMRPSERYLMMTQHFEAGSFELKARIMDRVRELNDFEADTLLAFDRNDEQHHVRYGTRWVPTLMEAFGEAGGPKEWLEETRHRYAAIARALTKDQYTPLSDEARISTRKIIEMVSRSAA
jgi:hypothetical protein